MVPIDPHELVRSLQFELKRVGCFSGPVNGEFDDATRIASQTFAKFSSIKMPSETETTPDAIKTLREIDRRICPLVCPDGERPDGDRCIANAPAHKAEPHEAAPRRMESRSHPKPNAEPPDSKDQSCPDLQCRWLRKWLDIVLQ